jgi:phage repressor protein C with HTH and peptisase S24 domain
MSQIKRTILEALQDGVPRKPAEISDITGLNAGTVRNSLRELSYAGEVVQPQYGHYSISKGVKEPDTTPESGMLLSKYHHDEKDEIVYVPLISALVSAGRERITFEPVVDSFEPYYAAQLRRELGFLPTTASLFRITGNSMEPTLSPGDRLLVGMEDRVPILGSIYLIRVGAGLMVKRLKHVSLQQLVFSSDNREYTDLVYDLLPESQEDIQIMGRVIKVEKAV